MDVSPGVRLVTPALELGDSGWEWVGDSRRHAGLPTHYESDNPVMRHLDRAVRSACDQLAALDHVHRTTQAKFRGVSYIAVDPSVAAFCTVVDNTHVVVVGAWWLFRLVKICERLGAALSRRQVAGTPPVGPRARSMEGDLQLAELLRGDVHVSETEANRVAECWPSPEYMYTEDQLGAWCVFYDLVRLVWYHEWAHALCGHLAVVQDDLHLTRLHESSVERATDPELSAFGASATEVLQNLEMHADEFAVRSNLLAILYGHDPAGLMLHTRVDLVDRLLHLNTAFCVFALLWELEEEKRAMPAGSRWEDRTHPPVALRYDRFRSFQRDASLGYDDHLMVSADVASLNFLGTLADVSSPFQRLAAFTPMVFRTPQLNEMERYEDYLMRLEPAISQKLDLHGFAPRSYFEPTESDE